MIVQHHLASRPAAGSGFAVRVSAILLILALSLAGCHHKTVRWAPPQVSLTPIELETPDAPDSPPEIATLPPPEFGPLQPAPPPKTIPKRKPAPATKEEVQPPVQVASESSPAALAIGSLSTGADVGPQSRQQTQDLIASISRRIAALPAKTAEAQKKQIRQVRNFVSQAQKALSSGDAEGANNLAIKAKVLMDDLEKK